MAVSQPKFGEQVKSKVVDMQGNCTISMQEGGELEPGIHGCDDFCVYFYRNIFNWISLLQMGGKIPFEV